MNTSSDYFQLKCVVPAVAARINCVSEQTRLIPGTVGRMMQVLTLQEARLFLADFEDPMMIRIADAGDFVVSASQLHANSIWLNNSEYQHIRRSEHKP